MIMAERNEMMTDADLMDAIQALAEKEPNDEVKELLKMMSDNRIISWEEAEQVMNCSNFNGPIKSSLPQQTRPTEPDNDTDVDWSIQQLQMDDPKLKQVNLNNMKRTPIPQVKRLLSAIKNNTHLEKIALANMGLYDNDCEPIFDVVASNTTLKSINLETNYLSGDFFARLFKAALVNQTLEEVKAVNQGVTFATTAEREIIDAVFENRGLTKVSINLRLPEGRHKIENAMIRNQEIRRILRRQAAIAAREAEEAQQMRFEEINKPIITTKPEMQSGKPQPMKPAILGSASEVSSVRKEPPHSKPVLASVISIFEKTTPDIIGNAKKTLLPTVANDRKTTSAILEEGPIADKQVKITDVINRTDTLNEVLAKATAPAQSSLPIVNSVKTTSKKAGLKRASTIAKTIDTIETALEKEKPKKTVRKKISLEQAVPEIELNTEEVFKKTSISKKSSLVAKENSIPSETNETATSLSTFPMTTSKLKNNSCNNSTTTNNFAMSKEETTNSTVPIRNEHFDKKPVRLMKNARSCSLVPPIFLTDEQKNEPVKRNFSIRSKKDSLEQEKIAVKFDERNESTLRSNPFNTPMPVYSLKRENNS
ncbi:unnamed protein product [Cercopithifilaria johnstoni]|uniref:Tropomodulin n=1 Tax=Cercopithifilaria johnstoni TaxID=2874296 RepID=A0A8J2MNP8_9BILA|nr:unnamed protein product [Cercopithifilaria johnstoni]